VMSAVSPLPYLAQLRAWLSIDRYDARNSGGWKHATATARTESGHTGCPALYATDRGTYVVQGKLVTDESAIADLLDVREDEFYVEIPSGLLRHAQGRE
jgi:hypothetical protein